MFYFKITVLKMISNKELAETYCRSGVSVCPYPVYQEGQVFTTKPGIHVLDKPEGFCEWAWNDIFKYVQILFSGGNMGDDHNYIKSNNEVIVCCTDGIRPVIFKVEKVKCDMAEEKGSQERLAYED